MLPISEDYLRSPCEVKAMDNKPILTGYLAWVGNNEIQIMNQQEALPIIHCNTTVKISVFNNALGFRVLVGNVYLSAPEFIRISDVQSLADYEQRNFFRVKVQIDTDARPKTDADTESEDLPHFPIQIRDLSLSGLYFTCAKELEIGDLISVRLAFYSLVYFYDCRIVRKLIMERAQADGYGCEFLDNSGPKGDLLCKYLFDCQREQIRKIKEQQL